MTIKVYQPQNREVFRNYWFDQNDNDLKQEDPDYVTLAEKENRQNLHDLALENPSEFIVKCDFKHKWTIDSNDLNEAYRLIELREDQFKILFQGEKAYSIEIGHLFKLDNKLYIVAPVGFTLLGS